MTYAYTSTVRRVFIVIIGGVVCSAAMTISAAWKALARSMAETHGAVRSS